MAEEGNNIENSPEKKMSTLSTSTSSFEPQVSHDPRLNELATNMFKKTANYLIGELNTIQADYEVLEKMNKATLTKYSDMKQITVNISNGIAQQNER